MIIKEAALLMGLSEGTVGNYIREGKIVANVVKSSGYRRGRAKIYDIPDEEVQRWMDQLPRKTGRPKKEVVSVAVPEPDIPKAVTGKPIEMRGGRIIGYEPDVEEIVPIKKGGPLMLHDLATKPVAETNVKVVNDTLTIRVNIKDAVNQYLENLTVAELHDLFDDLIIKKKGGKA